MMEQSGHLPDSESAVPQLMDRTRQAAELGTKYPDLNTLHYHVWYHIKSMVSHKKSTRQKGSNSQHSKMHKQHHGESHNYTIPGHVSQKAFWSRQRPLWTTCM